MNLINALANVAGDHDSKLRRVDGITYRTSTGEIQRADDQTPIQTLDDYHVGWELIDNWDRYRCFGLGRAAIVQFSRGCPHRCTYCGQHEFWTSWRHRHPEALAEEIAWLHDAHGVRFITLADENPTTSPKLWRRFLEALAARNRNVQIFATLRASDIVRDTDLMDLYRRAGVLYVLLGIDTTNPEIINSVHKRSTTTVDHEACRLLRTHKIRPIIAQIVGLGDESWSSIRRTRQSLRTYDGDLLNVMYATPHTWTSFAQQSADRPVVQADQRFWDYRHQVLSEHAIAPWRLFTAVKWMELTFHVRPARLPRMLLERDPATRRQLWWTTLHISAVWLAEIWEFIRHVRFARCPKKLRQWLGTTDSTPANQRRENIQLLVNGIHCPSRQRRSRQFAVTCKPAR